jgi:hypothetical protein
MTVTTDASLDNSALVKKKDPAVTPEGVDAELVGRLVEQARAAGLQLTGEGSQRYRVFDSSGAQVPFGLVSHSPLPQGVTSRRSYGTPVWGVIRVEFRWTAYDKCVPLANATVEDDGIHLAYAMDEIRSCPETNKPASFRQATVLLHH